MFLYVWLNIFERIILYFWGFNCIILNVNGKCNIVRNSIILIFLRLKLIWYIESNQGKNIIYEKHIYKQENRIYIFLFNDIFMLT